MQNECLSASDFERLRTLIHAESGINLSREKKTMLEVRLRRRLHGLHLSSCAEYCEYLFTPETRDHELVHLLDAVTTNKTDFFREAEHFEYLSSKALPELTARNGFERKLLVWSAGCSTGEEPYTLAMVLSEYAQAHAGFRFGVLAAIECAVRQRFTAGDHDVFVGQMVRARVAAGAPLIHFASHYRRLDVSR